MTAAAILLGPATSQDIIALRQGAASVGVWSVASDGLDPPEVLDILAALYKSLETDPGWGSWFIIHDGMIVGGCSLTEAPTADDCTIGYSVYPGSQGKGYATAAVGGMLGLLRGHGMTRVRAETSVGNVASQVVLERCGFERAGERVDPEDGHLVLWRRAL